MSKLNSKDGSGEEQVPVDVIKLESELETELDISDPVVDIVQSQYSSTESKRTSEPEVASTSGKQSRKRKIPFLREPVSKSPKTVKLVKKRAKAAMGIRRALRRNVNSRSRRDKLELLLNLPKEKFVKVTKDKKMKKSYNDRFKTMSPLKDTGQTRPPIRAMKKRKGQRNTDGLKSWQVLETKDNKIRAIGKPSLLQQKLNLGSCVKKKTENGKSKKLVTRPREPSKSKLKVSPTRSKSRRKSQRETSSKVPRTDETSVHLESTSAALEPASNPNQAIINFSEDLTFSPPPGSPDDNDDFESFPADLENSTPQPTQEQFESVPREIQTKGRVQDANDEIFRKYKEETVKCTFCQQLIPFYNFSVHLRLSHNHFEDHFQCPKCPRQFRRRDCWLFHIEVDHKYDDVSLSNLVQRAKEVNPKPFVKQAADPNSTQEKCDTCGDLFNSDYLATHKSLVHSGQKSQPKCPLCPNKSFKDTSLLWLHYCTKHADGTPMENMFPVELSEFYTRSKSGLTPRPPGTCHLCGLTFSTQYCTNRHLQKVHGVGEVGDNQWPCPTCGKKFKSKDTMDAHHRLVHADTVKSKCPHCPKTCQSPGKLWGHMIEAHHVSAAEAGSFCEVEWCVCEYCGVDVLVSRQYINHVKSNHPEHFKEFKANQAANPKPRIRTEAQIEREKLRSKERRQIARETGKGSKWIKLDVADAGECPECKEHIPKALTNHRRFIHGVKPEDLDLLACQVDGCQKAFKVVRDLIIHWRHSHTAEIQERIQDRMVIKVMEETDKFTVFYCTLCGNYMNYNEEVKIHCVVNHPDMFSDLWVVNKVRHVNCQYCKSSFERVLDLRKHVIQSHPEKTWKCETCGVVSLDLEEFDRHWEVQHAQKGLWFRTVGAKVSVKSLSCVLNPIDRKKRKAERTKWEGIEVKCEICGMARSAAKFHHHIRSVHEIEEDMDGLLCSICPERPLYKYSSRANWMWHMATFHNVGLEELKEEAGKVHTQQDWRNLNIKGHKTGSMRGAKGNGGEKKAEEVELMKKLVICIKRLTDEEIKRWRKDNRTTVMDLTVAEELAIKVEVD